jgi:hypothetical protein
MNNKFDELTKSLAQSVTRRQAFKKFGLGLAGLALACLGLADKAEAGQIPGWCDRSTNLCCCRGCHTHLPKSDPNYVSCFDICRLGLGC